MSTLTVQIPDQVRERIEIAARNHGRSVEEESAQILEFAAWQTADADEGIIPRDQLLAAAEAHHQKMAARGVCIPISEVMAAIKEARR